MTAHLAGHRYVIAAAVTFLHMCAARADPPPSPQPAKVEQVSKSRAEGLLGQPVTDGKANIVGRILDVLIDPSGKPQAAVIEFAGFFGFGNRQIAVDWQALRFALEKDHIAISLNLDADKLKTMPEYRPEAASVPVATKSDKVETK